MVLAVVEIVEVTLMENLLLNITVKDFSIMLHIWFGLEGNQLRCIGDHLCLALVGLLTEWRHATNIGFNSSSGRVMYVLM